MHSRRQNRSIPRGPRLDCPGALRHIIARGIERRRIFHSDGDRSDFLARIETEVAASACSVYAWRLMPNHIHILFRSGTASVSRVMQRVLAGYATAFNRRRHRCGHLFQNRFQSILVQEDASIAARYRADASLIASPSKQLRVVLARAAFCDQAQRDGHWSSAKVAVFLGILPMSVHRALRKQAALRSDIP